MYMSVMLIEKAWEEIAGLARGLRRLLGLVRSRALVPVGCSAKKRMTIDMRFYIVRSVLFRLAVRAREGKVYAGRKLGR